MDFKFLDDYLFQWLSAEQTPMALWPDEPIRMYTEQQNLSGDNGTAADHGEYQSSGLFWELTKSDTDQAELNVRVFDVGHRLKGFRYPSRYMTIRFIKGFFDYFSPHTPILHSPSFHIATCSAPLLLAIMACGALHVNEQEIGTRLPC